MKKFIALPLMLLLGCATLSEPDIIRISAAVKEASTIGTQAAVSDHPEWRPKFAMVSEELKKLAQQEKITVQVLLATINQLPVSELSSDRARLILAGVKLTIAIAGWSEVEIVQTEQVRPVVIALHEGIDAGLAAPTFPGVLGKNAGKYYKPR